MPMGTDFPNLPLARTMFLLLSPEEMAAPCQGAALRKLPHAYHPAVKPSTSNRPEVDRLPGDRSHDADWGQEGRQAKGILACIQGL